MNRTFKITNRTISKSLNKIILVTLVFSFCSCDYEAKNRSRKDLGSCVPENQKAIVIDKYTDNPGGETRYFVQNQIIESDSICSDLVTIHDFRFVKIGDTLSNKSARPYCLKVYGEACDIARWRNFKLIALIAIFIGIPSLLSIVYGEEISLIFQSTWIAQIWYSFTGFLNGILEINYGFNIFILIIVIAEFFMGVVLWNFGLEVNGEVSIQYVVNKLILLTVIAIVWMLIVGGINNLMRNLMVLSMGAIFVSLIIIFFAYSGMSYRDLLEFMLKPQSS